MNIKRMSLFNSNRPVSTVSFLAENNDLLLDPPYQRGDIWGKIRRRNLIFSILSGIPIPSIILNDRASAEWKDDYRMVVIDGKQRITTLLMWFDNKLTVDGSWFGLKSKEVTFGDLPKDKQRKFSMLPMAFSEGQLKTIEEEIKLFELINFGGVPQGETDSDAYEMGVTPMSSSINNTKQD